MTTLDNPLSHQIETFNQSLAFVNSFSAKHQEEKQKLPYHINILDLIWANENAHSRIFSELLKQKSNGKFEILDSFTEYLNKLSERFPRHFDSPKIRTEKNNIDIQIVGKDSVFIIENKIHDAGDQPNQLARYINLVSNTVGKNKDIFILYLTKDGTKEPNPYTWLLNGENYLDIYENNFLKINFRYDILPWLKTQVLPNVRLKDVFLKSTVEQYIDYLEGFFNQRTIHKNMNEELKKHISESLGLGESLEDNITRLEEKSKEIDVLKNQIIDQIQDVQHDLFQSWYNKLKSDFTSSQLLSPDEFLKETTVKEVGLIFSFLNVKFVVSLQMNKNEGLYFGVRRHSVEIEAAESIKKLCKDLNLSKQSTDWWYSWQYTDYQNAYSELSSLIKQIESYIAENSKK